MGVEITSKENKRLLKTLPISGKLHPHLIMTRKNVLLQQALTNICTFCPETQKKWGLFPLPQVPAVKKKVRLFLNLVVFEGFILIVIFEIFHVSLKYLFFCKKIQFCTGHVIPEFLCSFYIQLFLCAHVGKHVLMYTRGSQRAASVGWVLFHGVCPGWGQVH